MYRPTERVLSTVLIASIRVAVVGIENPAQNDASGPQHARVQLIRIAKTAPYIELNLVTENV